MVIKDNDKQGFSDRLNATLDIAGIKKLSEGRQTELGKMFKVSGNAARKWILGEAVPKYETLLKIIDKFSATGATLEWLLSGNPDLAPHWHVTEHSKKPYQNYTNHLNEPSTKGTVPLISFAQIGEWSETTINLRPINGERMVKVKVPVRGPTFALEVTGDSMEPEFIEGDTIIVEPSKPHKHGSYVIAKKGDAVFFRKIVKEGADWLLKPENKSQKPNLVTTRL